MALNYLDTLAPRGIDQNNRDARDRAKNGWVCPDDDNVSYVADYNSYRSAMIRREQLGRANAAAAAKERAAAAAAAAAADAAVIAAADDEIRRLEREGDADEAEFLAQMRLYHAEDADAHSSN